MSGNAEPAAFEERVVRIDCAGEGLVGVVSAPASGPVQPRSVLIAVGGPQYRVGSHRQFVLLARRLAAQGFATLRFDYRGMGDSEGEPRRFDAVEEDLRAAIAAASAETGNEELVVVGLCDAASAALMFATTDPRVKALVLLNPWVRDGASLAATHLKHYYGGRLLQGDFWRKLFEGRLDWRASLRSVLADAGVMFAGRRHRPADSPQAPFQSRMAAGLRRFEGRTLLLLSGQDMTAREFGEYTQHAPDWSGLLAGPRVERFEMPAADHTLSAAASRLAAEDRILQWLRSL